MGEPLSPPLQKELLERLSTATTQAINKPLVADVSTILRNLDGQFVRRYLLKLEEARIFLTSYLEELANLERRLDKADPATRLALGSGEALAAKRLTIEATLQKLSAHQRATMKRVFNG